MTILRRQSVTPRYLETQNNNDNCHGRMCPTDRFEQIKGDHCRSTATRLIRRIMNDVESFNNDRGQLDGGFAHYMISNRNVILFYFNTRLRRSQRFLFIFFVDTVSEYIARNV